METKTELKQLVERLRKRAARNNARADTRDTGSLTGACEAGIATGFALAADDLEDWIRVNLPDEPETLSTDKPPESPRKLPLDNRARQCDNVAVPEREPYSGTTF